MKRYRRISCIGCLSLALLVPLLVCAVQSYISSTWSANTYLARLSGRTDMPLNFEQARSQARSALLERLPVGTPAVEIIAFLEQNGIERDRFEGGQLMRYQVQPEYRSILGLLSDPPELFSFCSGTGYIIHFRL